MKIHNRKYNFKSLESLMNITSEAKQTSSDHQTILTKNKSISQGKKKTNRKKISSKSTIAFKPHKSSSVDSLCNASFEKNEKTLETQLKLITKANTFNRGFFLAKSETKSNLNARVKTLSTFINLHRIESTNMSLLSKGELKEKVILTFKSNRIKEDCYYLKNKVPFLKEEVNAMKAELEEKKKETIALNSEILLLQKDIMTINDDIKKYNKLNSNQSLSKENMQSTIDLLKKHNERLRENIRNQKEKTGKLVHSSSVLSKTIQRHMKNIVSPKRVFSMKKLY